MDYRVDGFYTNSSNTLSIMDWYHVVPRTDNIQTPVQDFAQGFGIASGEGTTGGTTSQTSTSGLPGVTPFMSS